MSYLPLGYRFVVASADTTGQNKGNYTAQFSQSTWLVDQAIFETARIVVENCPLLTQFTILLNSKKWDVANGGFNSFTSWDGINPVELRPGDELTFLFQLATSVTPAPVVTLWLRVDPALPNNQQMGGL